MGHEWRVLCTNKHIGTSAITHRCYASQEGAQRACDRLNVSDENTDYIYTPVKVRVMADVESKA